MTTEITTAKNELTQSQKFTEKVLAEFTGGVGEIAVTDFQKRLIQGYFITIDAVLKKAELNRLKKDEKKRDALPIIWQNVNLETLAQTAVHVARLGLDSLCPNHINFIPFKNKATGKYDLTLIMGYKGKEVQAVKYGLDVPETLIFELVYTTDIFKPVKRSLTNKVESYEFEMVNPFNRGEIMGGFAYGMFKDENKNRLLIMSMKDFEKRKPEYASTEFWGGEKTIWKDGKPSKEKEKVEGWLDEMCMKTLKRAAYSQITIDSQRIDDTYQFLKQRENDTIDTRVQDAIEENANSEVIDITCEVKTPDAKQEVKPETERKPEF